MDLLCYNHINTPFLKEKIMSKSLSLMPIKICALTALLLLTTSTANAFQMNDESSLKLNLVTDWKITNSRNALGANKEVFLETTLKKSATGKNTDPIVKKLYASTKKLMGKNGCAYEDIQRIPQTAGENNEWGIFWQCAHNKRSGFMVFIDADPTTMYTLTYKADESYPLTPINRNNMQKILQTIQLCYTGKSCVAFIK
jgi:hypothetical protein